MRSMSVLSTAYFKARPSIMGKIIHPSSEEIRSAREAVGLTQTEASRLVRGTLRTWQGWETASGPSARKMHPGLFELFLMKVGRFCSTQELSMSEPLPPPYLSPNAPTIETVLASADTSHFLRNALLTCLDRDPVDAANDAQLLADLLRQRADRIAAACFKID